MSQAPAMPVFTDALIGDTTHLTAEEFGAYCLILFATWRNNGVPFDDDNVRLCRVARVEPRRWSRLRPTLAKFFDLSGGTWKQKRLEKEWNRTQNLIEIRRQKGMAGAEARWLKNNDSGDGSSIPSSNGLANGKGNGLRYGNHTHTHNNPPISPQGGLRRNGKNNDPWNINSMSEDEMISRLNRKDITADEREALRYRVLGH